MEIDDSAFDYHGDRWQSGWAWLHRLDAECGLPRTRLASVLGGCGGCTARRGKPLTDKQEVPYQLLIKLETKGTELYDIYIGNDLVEVNVKELLNGVRADSIPDVYRLKELIVECLSLDELDDLCLKFKISIEDIEGQMTIDSKTRNLTRQFVRAGRLPELIAVLRELHPEMAWK